MGTYIASQLSEQRIAEAEITKFAAIQSTQTRRRIPKGDSLEGLMLDNSESFLSALWDHIGVNGDNGGAPYVTAGDVRLVLSLYRHRVRS